VKGWLLDTNVIASLIAGAGAPSVKAWAAQQDEERLFLSVLTLAEYDKGIAKLAPDHPDRLSPVSTRETFLAVSRREDFWFIAAARSEDEQEIRAG
jgi:predicted nucleic acid-binding protein